MHRLARIAPAALLDATTPRRMTLPTLREALDAHGLAAKKSFGQHFLLDLNVTRKIVRLATLEFALAANTLAHIRRTPKIDHRYGWVAGFMHIRVRT